MQSIVKKIVKNKMQKLYRRTTKRGKNVRYNGQLKRRSNKYHIKWTYAERTEILKRDNYICQTCNIKVHDRSTGKWNTPDKAHIDHIISLVDGGLNELNNLQTLCRTCNLEKGRRR